MNAKEIIKKLVSKGHEAYVIGGAVRDMLMGLPAKDEDVVTKARPAEIVKIFKGQKISEVGKTFGIVIVDGIEVATYRKDRYEGYSDKKVEISYADSLYDDVIRRDFTINTIAWDPIKNEIIDHLHGREDIANKVIRFVNDPYERIIEDPNRILRAIRFAARFDFSIDVNTWNALQMYRGFVKNYVAKERIHKELMESMKIRNASLFFRYLHELGSLKDFFPSVDACWKHSHGKYHREDIFEHLMATGDNISTKYPLLKLAAYLHDVGKPVISRKNKCQRMINSSCHDPERDKVDDNDNFIGHEIAGADLIASELKNLGFGKEEIHYISAVIRLHMRAHLKFPSPKSIRRYLVKMHESGIAYADMMRLCNADLTGSDRNIEEEEDRFEKLYKLMKQIRIELERPAPVHALHYLALNGNDVMRITGIPAGPEIGRLLKKLHEAVIDDPELNAVPALTEVLNS